MTPQVTPARSAIRLALAAEKPSSTMQAAASAISRARVSSPRARDRRGVGARVGETIPASVVPGR